MSPIRVVVADDSEIYRAALCDFLNQMPEIEVAATAQDGAEALRLVQAVHPDALLLDLEMPGMDGWEVLRRLSADPWHPYILVISSHSGSSFQQLALDEGATAYINKGNAEQVVDVIYDLVAG